MSIIDIVNNKMCTGCGICQNICPQRAIDICRNENIYLATVTESNCITDHGCSLCESVCPGMGIDLESYGKILFPNCNYDFDIGFYKIILSGYCNTYEIRYHSASGGLISGLLVWMLEMQIIQGAFVTLMCPDKPLEPRVILASTPEDIINASSSKYCPVSFKEVLRQAETQPGDFAFVGLPCHVLGVRKLMEVNSTFNKKIKWLFGLYCSSSKTFSGTRYILDYFNIDEQDIREIKYRDEGCLGSLKIVLHNNTIIRKTFLDYYPLLRSFFNPFRCTMCQDHFAELADISFGDIYIPPYSSDSTGISSMIIRSTEGLDLINKSAQAKLVNLNALGMHDLKESQQGSILRKKHHTFYRLKFFKFMGYKVPIYHSRNIGPHKLIERLKCMKSNIILYAEMFLGKHRICWPIIDFVNMFMPLLKKLKP